MGGVVIVVSATSIPAGLLVALGFVNCEMRSLAVALLCLTVGINSTCRAGFTINHVDISPRQGVSCVVDMLLCIHHRS